MKKRSLIIVAGIVIIMINLYFISAGLYYSNLDDTYNLGDTIDLWINVEPVLEGRLVEVDLVCNGGSVIKFNVFPDESGNTAVVLPLNSFTVKEASGDCYFSGSYAEEVRQSNVFKISKRLNVFLDTDSFFANPGEEIVVSGNAKRMNGEMVNGEIEISIPLLNLLNGVQDEEEIVENASEEEVVEEIVEEVKSADVNKFYGKVLDGAFSVPISLGKNTPAGDYRVDILVYENVGGIKASEEVVLANLKIFQILTNIDIAFSNQNTDPGLDYSSRPRLLDQTGMIIPEEVSIIIKNSIGERIFEKIVQSDETVVYSIPSNLTAGYYGIEASKGEVKSVKKFYVNEKAIASFEIINETLIITNIGNIPYKKDVEIELNGKPFIKSVSLELGEKIEYKLTGSGEEYNIRVGDGYKEITMGGVVLTGNAVGVKEIGDGMFTLKTPIIWIFFIIILGAGILFLFRNVFKKKSFAYPTLKKSNKNKESKPQEKGEVKNKKESSPGTLVPPSKAEQVLVLKGHKNNASVIVLKIKNKISKNSKVSLEKSIEPAYGKRGAVYEQGDYIFILFSPIMTKTHKNEIEAAKVAQNILKVLKEHNKKFKDKIEFGIGINSGEIINKVEDKKLKFTALGNFISTGKRLAESSDEQILITKIAYERGISEIKAEKKAVAGGEVYELRSIVDNEKNQKFIKSFLERQKKENGKLN